MNPEYNKRDYEKRKNDEPWTYPYYASRARTRGERHPIYKGLPNTLTKEEVKTLWLRDKADEMIKPSINKIVNSLGYTFENCEFIEHSVNSADPRRKHRPKEQFCPLNHNTFITGRYKGGNCKVCTIDRARKVRR